MIIEYGIVSSTKWPQLRAAFVLECKEIIIHIIVLSPMYCLCRSIDETLIEFKRTRLLQHELCKVHSLKVLIM